MRRDLYRTLAMVSALLLVACDAAGETDELEAGSPDEEEEAEAAEEAEEEEEAEQDDEPASEEADDADDASEGADAGSDETDAPADPDGFVRIDGEEHPLTSAFNCEPRESSSLMDPRRPGSAVEGMIEFRTMGLGSDDAFAIDVWEQTTDGVRAQRLFSELLGLERSIAAEGDEEYPLFEVDGDRVTVEAQHPVDADVLAEVYAEWTFPDSYEDC